MKLKRTRSLALSLALLMIPAVGALAKPVSTYHVDFYLAGAEDVLSIEFNDTDVTAVTLSMSCTNGNVLSYESTSVDGSTVVVGPKAGRFNVSAQFSASFTDCDGSSSFVSRFVRVSNFVSTGATVRERDRVTGTRTLSIPVDADVHFTTLPNQPLGGVLTEVIAKA